MPVQAASVHPRRTARLPLALLLAAGPGLPGAAAWAPGAGMAVYVAGSEDSVRPAATLWKDGQPSPLGGLPRFARPTAVALADGNVYACGWAEQPPLTLRSEMRMVRTAMTWKNGVPAPLTAGSSWAVAMGLAVVGGDQYVVGAEDERARLWKDGRPVPLETGSRESWARGVARCGNDVLVVGNEWSGIDGTSVAMLWRNGRAVPLTDGGREACASAIAVSGKDFYVAGYESNGRVRVAKVWKNGKPFLDLTDGSRDAEAVAVKAAGDRVVTAGHEAVGQPLRTGDGPAGTWLPVATVWMNAKAVRLTDGKRFAWAHSVDLAGAGVVAVGEELAADEGSNTRVTVWKVTPSGEPEPPVRLTRGDTSASGVAVAVGGPAQAGDPSDGKDGKAPVAP